MPLPHRFEPRAHRAVVHAVADADDEPGDQVGIDAGRDDRIGAQHVGRAPRGFPAPAPASSGLAVSSSTGMPARARLPHLAGRARSRRESCPAGRAGPCTLSTLSVVVDSSPAEQAVEHRQLLVLRDQPRARTAPRSRGSRSSTSSARLSSSLMSDVLLADAAGGVERRFGVDARQAFGVDVEHRVVHAAVWMNSAMVSLNSPRSMREFIAADVDVALSLRAAPRGPAPAAWPG